MSERRAVVIGAGPNGLSAAVELARAGCRVEVHEAAPSIGGGTRSEALTLPGFLHDVCSAVHPMGAGSPFFASLPLDAHGVEWVHPDAPLAHPLDDGTAVLLERPVEATAATLDRIDAVAYARVMRPLVERWPWLVEDVLAPLHLPRHPLVMARFARHALRSAVGLASSWFRGARARALFLGIAAHAFEPLTHPPTAAFGLVLAAAGHAVGWPVCRGGSQRIAEALAAVLKTHGGEIITGRAVRSVSGLVGPAVVLLDLTPRQVLRLAEPLLPARYRRALARYRYGPGVFKIDWALLEPIPWRAAECRRAGTVHLGGPAEEIVAAAAAPWRGRVEARPFVLLSQPTLFDPSRAPRGRHVAWAYCHAPHGSEADLTDAIEAQVERFAPGFRDAILARHTRTAVDVERHNENLVGGDISGGTQDLRQLFFRPAARIVPYATPVRGLYLCSAATPPGAGVHGMCGYHAAQAALRRLGR